MATVEMETLIKGQTAETVSGKELKLKLAKLENVLVKALDAVHTLDTAVEKGTLENIEVARNLVSPELIKKVANRIEEAAELGDAVNIKSIAEELMSESDEAVPFCDELVQLAGDFDFDGIQKLIES